MNWATLSFAQDFCLAGRAPIAMLSNILHRLLSQVDRFGGPRRLESCPPALLQVPGMLASGWRKDLRAWLNSGWNRPTDGAAGAGAHHPVKRSNDDPRFRRVRDEFLEALQDIRTQQVGMLQQRIGIALSLRELWHLRPEVFRLVALHFSQAEAQCRLDRLNRHFPTRSPRSGFAPLDP